MNIQNSYEKRTTGTLYLVPTPIGNLDDMTFRAIKILQEVEVIAAEDTRHTQKLLNHFDIQKELISYHEHNRIGRLEQLMDRLAKKQDIALVSDAGMPAISDPGYELVQTAIERGFSIVPLPGANAALTALIASGLQTEQFYFYGFLPRKKQEKEAVIKSIGRIDATVILYESPYRVKDSVQLIEKTLGNRQIVIARELTKVYEQFIRGSAEDVIEWLSSNTIKGECCILLEGSKGEIEPEDNSWWNHLTVEEHVSTYEKDQGIPHKEALKRVAKDRGVSKRDVYQQIHVKHENG